jgi:hypothetical protein
MGWMVCGRNPRRARVSAVIQTSPKAHPAFQTMGTGALARGVALTIHPLLGLRLRKNRGVPLLPLCAFMECYRENLYQTLLSVFVSWNIACCLVTAYELNAWGQYLAWAGIFLFAFFSKLAVGLLMHSLTL